MQHIYGEVVNRLVAAAEATSDASSRCTPRDTGGRPRADARLNQGRILSAARAGFSQYGTEARVSDIARDAGVGVGTVYRSGGRADVGEEKPLLDALDAATGELLRGAQQADDARPGVTAAEIAGLVCGLGLAIHIGGAQLRWERYADILITGIRGDPRGARSGAGRRGPVA